MTVLYGEKGPPPGERVARDRWGRPVLKMDDGKRRPFTRASGLASVLEDRYGLEQWQQRQVALGLAARHDLVMLLRSKSDPDTLREVIDKAHDAAGSGAGATWGTIFHAMSERVDETGLVPPGLDEDITRALVAYREMMGRFGLVVESSEQFVGCEELMAAGSYDRLLRCPSPDPDGVTDGLYIGDIKTGRDAWKHAHGSSVQFAVYANGAPYEPDEEEWGVPLADQGVSTRWAIMIHVDRTATTVRPYWIDIDTGMRYARTAVDVRAWLKTSLATPLEREEA